jgi:hypothetical protein
MAVMTEARGTSATTTTKKWVYLFEEGSKFGCRWLDWPRPRRRWRPANAIGDG